MTMESKNVHEPDFYKPNMVSDSIHPTRLA